MSIDPKCPYQFDDGHVSHRCPNCAVYEPKDERNAQGSKMSRRFRNILQDLIDCHDAWDEPIEDEEVIAREQLAKLCRQIAREVFD